VAGAWPFILASSAIHLVYWTALTKGYADGDMSHVYTIARGIAPALVTLGAVIFAAEMPGVWQGLGVAAISIGVMLVGVNRHAPLTATAWALLTGVMIAGYSLVDAMGVRVNGDVFSYKGWGAVFTFLPISLFVIARRGPAGFAAAAAGRWRQGVFAGGLSSAGFMLVLWAQLRAPIGPLQEPREPARGARRAARRAPPVRVRQCKPAVAEQLRPPHSPRRISQRGDPSHRQRVPAIRILRPAPKSGRTECHGRNGFAPGRQWSAGSGYRPR
jgi:hypothetical protein